MLRILGSPKKLCNGLTRREMLVAGGLSLFGLGQEDLFRLSADGEVGIGERILYSSIPPDDVGRGDRQLPALIAVGVRQINEDAAIVLLQIFRQRFETCRDALEAELLRRIVREGRDEEEIAEVAQRIRVALPRLFN